MCGQDCGLAPTIELKGRCPPNTYAGIFHAFPRRPREAEDQPVRRPVARRGEGIGHEVDLLERAIGGRTDRLEAGAVGCDDLHFDKRNVKEFSAPAWCDRDWKQDSRLRASESAADDGRITGRVAQGDARCFLRSPAAQSIFGANGKPSGKRCRSQGRGNSHNARGDHTPSRVLGPDHR